MGDELEIKEPREVLFFASYCGGDDPDCSPRKPCPDCLAMSNVFVIPAGTRIVYQREFASTPLKGGAE